jgi:hypothetical protein
MQNLNRQTLFLHLFSNRENHNVSLSFFSRHLQSVKKSLLNSLIFFSFSVKSIFQFSKKFFVDF